MPSKREANPVSGPVCFDRTALMQGAMAQVPGSNRADPCVGEYVDQPNGAVSLCFPKVVFESRSYIAVRS